MTEKGISLCVGDNKDVIQADVGDGRNIAGKDCIIGIRPEHLALRDAGTLSGTVIATEILGSETLVFANLQHGESVTASIRGIRSLEQGATVRFSVDPRFVHVFDDQGLTLAPLRSWREDYVDRF